MKKTLTAALALAVASSGLFAYNSDKLNGNMINLMVKRDAGTNIYMFNGFKIQNVSLKGMLDKLSKYQNVTYIYNGKDIKLPDSSNVVITSIEDLKHYLATTTPYTLKIKETDRGLDIYHVYLVNKSDNPFTVKTKIDKKNVKPVDVLYSAAKKLGYSLNISNDALNRLSKKLPVLKADSYAKALSIIENAANVFIDIDNVKKTINVYAKKTYEYQISSLVPKTLKNLTPYLKTIVKGDNGFYVDPATGMIVFNTDYNTYLKVNTTFNKLNFYTRQNVNFQVYLFKVRSYQDIDWNYFRSRVAHTYSLGMVKTILSDIGTILSSKKIMLSTKNTKPTVYQSATPDGKIYVKITPKVVGQDKIEVSLNVGISDKFGNFVSYQNEYITHNGQKQLIGLQMNDGTRYFMVISASFNPYSSE